jgi:hypothetical protein
MRTDGLAQQAEERERCKGNTRGQRAAGAEDVATKCGQRDRSRNWLALSRSDKA